MDAIATECGIVRFDANRRVVTAAGTSAADEEQWRVDDEKLDQALKGTFPASDPFSLG